MDNLKTIEEKIIKDQSSFVIRVLKGLSQIMLQESSIVGLLFLIGIAYSSFAMALAALFASIVGTLSAIVLKFDKTDIDKGIFGFSAALVGVALILFLQDSIITWALIVIGSIAASVLQQFFLRKKLPVFTFPFVFVVWLILFFVNFTFNNLLNQIPPSELLSDYYLFPIRGFGQVIFQVDIFSGVILLIAVLINSPISAVYALLGALLSGILAQLLGIGLAEISNGLLSFNAVLCAIVFAGKKLIDGLWVVLSVILAMVISIIFLKNGLPQLTFPFVASSFIFVKMKAIINC